MPYSAPACVVLDCSAVTCADSQGSAALGELVTLAEEEGLTLRLARLEPAVGAVLSRDGVLARIGVARVHASVDDAVRAQPGSPPEPSGAAGE